VAYVMSWDNIQIQANDPNIFALGYVNFPEAEITGLEFEFSWLVTPGLLMSGGYAYLDASISQDSQILGEDGSIVAEVTDGTQLPISPENKANLALDYNFQNTLWGMEPHMRLDYVFVGESLNSLAGTESIVFTREPTEQDSYSIVNFRAGLTSDNWDLTVYADNLTDEVAEQFFNNRYGSRQRLSINKPRSIGFTARYKF
jgi:outer membrane receptor protein involved in Fe transport